MNGLDEFLDQPSQTSTKLLFSPYVIIFLLGSIILIITIICYVKYQKEEDKNVLIETKKENYIITKDIYIDISGAVNVAGVYPMQSGQRVQDVLIKAGGLQEKADKRWIQMQLNLASTLNDGQKIYIPFEGEVREEKNSIESNSTLESSKLNINSASQTELETLPKIGPVIAKSIIEYRQNNGNFNDILDIKRVPGIGESLFEQIKEQISTN